MQVGGSRLVPTFPKMGTNYTNSQMETAAWPLGVPLGLLVRKFVLVDEKRISRYFWRSRSQLLPSLSSVMGNSEQLKCTGGT